MTQFAEIGKEFNSFVQQNKFIEAVDRFYHMDIISTDNNNNLVIGIDNFHEAVKIFIVSSKMGKIELLSSIVDENLSVAHWHYIFTAKNFGKLD